MNKLTKTAAVLVAALLLPLAGHAAAEDANPPMSLEDLLQAVKEGRSEDRDANSERLREFQRTERNREQMLADMRARRAQLEAISAEREASFEANEQAITDLEERLQERMGSLKELFGVLQQVASDAQAQFHGSLTAIDHPGRTDFLVDFAGRMGQANRLPEIAEIERLWFELQQEMTESGQVVTRQHSVMSAAGAEESRAVTRVGLFNAVSDGKYLQFISETGRLLEFSRQPGSVFLQGPKALSSGDTGVVPFAVDPVRGQLLEILTQAPDLGERIAQGGAIGYAIIGLGIAGLLLALGRLVILSLEARRIDRQLKQLEQPMQDNALGRIMLAANAQRVPNAETLELRLGEAVLAEVPRISRYLPLLKIIAGVAPLIGLLGTVTGMIITFQAITLFGAGDPRLMAGGISQALITTVLGLCVAIPILLLHNLVQTRARTITEILQHKAVALVAAHAETVTADVHPIPEPGAPNQPGVAA